MDFEDKTVRELTEAANRNAKAERADPNEPVRKQIVADTTRRIMDALGLDKKEER